MSAVNASAISALVERLVRELLERAPFLKNLIATKVKEEVDEFCKHTETRLHTLEEHVKMQNLHINRLYMEKCYMQCYIDDYVQTNGEKFVLPNVDTLESFVPMDPCPTPAMMRPPPRVPPVAHAVPIPSFIDNCPAPPRLRPPKNMRLV